MFSFLKPYALLIQIAACLALAVAIYFGVQHILTKHEQIGYDKRTAEYVLDENAKLKAARAESDRLQTKLNEAQYAKAELLKKLSDVSAALGDASARLRDATNNVSIRLPNTADETTRSIVASLATVFNECQGRYGALAEKADRCLADLQEFDAGWPSPELK